MRDYASQFEAMSAKKDEEAFAAANPTGALTLATADPASGGVSMTAYTAALASLTHTLTSAGSSKVRLISEWDLTYADLSLPAPADWDGYGVNQLLNVLTEMRKTAGPPGATFTPHMSAQGVLSWTNDGNLSNPAPVSLRGPQGNSGLVDYRPLLETIFNPKLQLTDEPAASTARQTVLWTELRAHASHFSTPILLRSLRLYAAATPAKNPLVLTLWEELREEWTWRACSLPATVSGGTVTEFTFDPPVPVNGSASPPPPPPGRRTTPALSPSHAMYSMRTPMTKASCRPPMRSTASTRAASSCTPPRAPLPPPPAAQIPAAPAASTPCRACKASTSRRIPPASP